MARMTASCCCGDWATGLNEKEYREWLEVHKDCVLRRREKELEKKETLMEWYSIREQEKQKRRETRPQANNGFALVEIEGNIYNVPSQPPDYQSDKVGANVPKEWFLWDWV